MGDSNYVDSGVLAARMAEGTQMTMALSGAGVDAQAFESELPVAAAIPAMRQEYNEVAPNTAEQSTKPDHTLDQSMKIGQ